jgi:hypothetical protein
MMERAAPYYRRELVRLTEGVGVYLAKLDAIMKMPGTVERGKLIAKLSNDLEMLNDGVRYGALGIDFRTDTKPERKA